MFCVRKKRENIEIVCAFIMIRQVNVYFLDTLFYNIHYSSRSSLDIIN